jgi:hypothetical protein
MQGDKEQHQFIFQRGSQTPVIVSYGELPDAAAPGFQVKTIDVDNFIAHCINTPRPVGMIDAFFDNVFVNQSALLP